MADSVIVQSNGHTTLNCIFFKGGKVILEIYDHKNKTPEFSKTFESNLSMLNFMSNISNLYFSMLRDEV